MLGYRSLTDLMGRSDLLKMRDLPLAKTKGLDLGVLMQPPVAPGNDWLNHEPVHSNGPVLDDSILADQEISDAISHQYKVAKTLDIVNTDRTVGARIAGKIASMYGNSGFSGEIALTFNGSAGQSFGAFNLPGMILTLNGEANDYVGKGMHGGELIVKPSDDSTLDSGENVIIGNTCLYGATGGTLFARGQAGERFAVRNSMGQAVIEGAGDHCCEYMTGGVVVVLGKVGRNVGAGMTGGIAYFLDPGGSFPDCVNGEIVRIQRVATSQGEAQLRGLIQDHSDRTGSKVAASILANWSEFLPKFWQVVPPSEENTPEVSPKGSDEKVAVGAS